MNVKFEQRAYFKTQLFNETTNEYNEIILTNLIKHYKLTTAKGSSKYKLLSDMPYHIHIINGIYPALLLFEELLQKEQIENKSIEHFLKVFMVAFTLHDLNKLTDEDDLKQTIEKDLLLFLDILETDQFFPEWKDYIDEIKFIILKTEERTRNLANDLQINERQFVNDYLAELSQLADKFGSIKNFDNIVSFFDQTQKITFKSYKKLSDIWELSYIGINENIYTLLSQKLLSIVREYICTEKQNNILFNLRNGIVFIGEPLVANDLKIIKQNFSNPIQDEINPVEATKIDEQQVNFGFTDMMQLNKHLLWDIVRSHLSRKLLAINTNEYFNSGGHNNNLAEIIPDFLDENELPLEIIDDSKANKWAKFIYQESKEWDDLEADEQKILYAIGLEKIKYLATTRWGEELKRSVLLLSEKSSINSPDKKPNRTIKTLAAMQKISILLEENDVNEIIHNQEDEILEFFSSQDDNFSDSTNWEQFVDMNLVGNFDNDPDNFNFDFRDIPKKPDMCVICGQKKKNLYNDAKSFGIAPRGFNNRSNNTLKSTKVNICETCNTEIQFRRSFFAESRFRNSVCIYLDMGDYFINYIKQNILNIFRKTIEMEFVDSKNNTTVTIEKFSFDYDYYSLVFYSLSNKTESHFYFIQKMLKIIKQLSFKIYVQDLISPYFLQKEMFVFDNCMPFVKTLGWNRIRIDQIDSVLEEISLFFTFGKKQITSNILKYAENKLSIFSIYYGLKEDDRKKVANKLTDFINKNKEEFVMSVMDKITDYAVKASWGFGSMGEETWMIREALDVLKLGCKEKLDRETIIEQIAGMLYKKLKGDSGNVDQTNLYNFSTSVYDDLFTNEWKGKIPQPGRMKNWIYQFAFLYSKKSLDQIKINAIQSTIKELKRKGETTSEEAVMNVLKKDKNKKKYIEQYIEIYKKIFQN